MKKNLKRLAYKFNYVLVGILLTCPAFADGRISADNSVCELIRKFGGVFKTLRILAFLGAAFYIISWAWEWIKGGEVKMDDVKKKSTALIIGFSLLFLVGIILSVIMRAADTGGSLGCVDDFTHFGEGKDE